MFQTPPFKGQRRISGVWSIILKAQSLNLKVQSLIFRIQILISACVRVLCVRAHTRGVCEHRALRSVFQRVSRSAGVRTLRVCITPSLCTPRVSLGSVCVCVCVRVPQSCVRVTSIFLSSF